MKMVLSVLCAGVITLFSAYLILSDGGESPISGYIPVLSLFGLVGLVTAPFLLRVTEGITKNSVLEWCFVMGLVFLSLPILLIPFTLGFSILMMPIMVILGPLFFVPACALLVLRRVRNI